MLNYIPILKEYNYKIPTINMDEIKEIIDDTLVYFPLLKKEEDFKNIIFKIIENNYKELLSLNKLSK